MRTIKYTSRFKRDYKREKSGVLGKKLDGLLKEALENLAADAALPARYVDHALIGEWCDHRDCHIRPDLILIHRKLISKALNLSASARTASWACSAAFSGRTALPSPQIPVG